MLIEIYTNMIREESNLTDKIRLLITSHYTEKWFDVKKLLIDLLVDSNEKVSKNAKKQIRNLRL